MQKTRVNKHRHAAVAVAAFALLTVVVFLPAASHPSRFVNGSLDDAYAIFWQLWWFKFSVADLHALPFFSGFVESPFGVTLTQMTIVNHLLALPLTMLFGPVGSYNILILLSFFLSAVGMYLLVHELTGSPPAAFLAGAAYAFSPYHTVFTATGGMDAAQIQYLPFMLLFLMRHARSSCMKDLALTFVFFVLTVFSFGYYAVLAALSLAVYLFYCYVTPVIRRARPGSTLDGHDAAMPAHPIKVIAYAVAGFALWVFAFNLAEEVDLTLKLFTSAAVPLAALVYVGSIRSAGALASKGRDARGGGATTTAGSLMERIQALEQRHRAWMMAGAVVFIAAVSVILLPVFTAAARPISFSYIAPALSYILPAPDHPIFGAHLPGWMIPDGDPLAGRMVYAGFTLPIIAVIGVLVTKRPSVGGHRAGKSTAWTLEARRKGFFVVLLATGVLLLIPPIIRAGEFNIYSPVYFFHRIVPPFVDMRRIILIVLAAASVLAGFGVAAMSARLRSRVFKAVLYLLALLCLAVEFMPQTSYSDMTEVPGAYAFLAGLEGEPTVIEYPLTSIYDARRYEAFFGQTVHEKRVVNPFAAVGHDPRPASDLLRKFIDRGGAAWDPLANPENAGAALARLGVGYAVVRTDKLGPVPEELAGFTRVASFEDSAVYRVDTKDAGAAVSFEGFARNGFFENYVEREAGRYVTRNPYHRVSGLWTGRNDGQAEAPWLGLSGRAALSLDTLSREPGLFDLVFTARSLKGPARLVLTVGKERTEAFNLTEAPAKFAVRGIYLDPVDGPLKVKAVVHGAGPGMKFTDIEQRAMGVKAVDAAIRDAVLRVSRTGAAGRAGPPNASLPAQSAVRGGTYDGIYIGLEKAHN